MSRQLEQREQLYKSGMVQKKIAERLGITEGAVTYRLQRYQENYRIKKPPLPPSKSKPKKTNFLSKKYDPKWHRMHCGKGKKTDDIAHIEACEPDLVRETLQNYCEEMWGGMKLPEEIRVSYCQRPGQCLVIL